MQAEYSREKLEKLSLAELEQIIRSQPLDDLDPDIWTSVMEEYLCRREAPRPDAETAFAEFCERYSGSGPIFAVEEDIPASSPGVRRGLHTALRVTLIAAALAALLGVTAYAADWLGLRSRLADTGHMLNVSTIGEGGEGVSYEAEAMLLVPTGHRESPEYQASVEWFRFWEEYMEEKSRDTSDWRDFEGAQALLGTDIYLAWDTVMAEKLLEICDKYGLKLHTDMSMASSLDEFYALAGTEPFGLPDGVVSSPGYVFEDGSFKAEGFTEIDGENTIFTISKFVSGTMPPFPVYLAEPENYQEWSYTTAGGCTVCIDYNTKADDMGHTVLIFYSQKDAFIRLSGSVPGGPEQAEELAERFDFEKACGG